MLKRNAGAIVGDHVTLSDRDVIYTRREAAAYLRKSEPTLERWARVGIGPKPVRIGLRGIGYTLRSLREATGTSEAA
jgi:hypothetical protein